MTDATELSKDPERRFQQALGHVFADRALLLEALTHRSYANEHGALGQPPIAFNERLEYLGDAVLNLVVSAELMRRFEWAREGELSRMRAAIVHEAALARLARRIQLGPALRLGRGEELSGGRERSSLLADAFEAVVAAVYLEAGFARAHDVLVELIDFEPGERLADADPKTKLQQRLQADHKLAPRYRLVSESGPEHEKRFVVEVVLEERVLGVGAGRTKKRAEQQAAATVLARLEATDTPPAEV